MLRALIIKALGGYTDAVEAIRALRATGDNEQAHDILTQAVRHLYATISYEDILREDNYGNWFIGERKLDKAEVQTLMQEAQFLNRSFLWKILKQDIGDRAGKRTLLRARTEADLIAGKLWLWTLDMLQTRLNAIEKGSATLNDKDTP